MTTPGLCYGIPDIILRRVGGGEINPAAFIGHEFVFFFCPAEPTAAAAEFAAYRERAEAFAAAGAWLIGVVGDAPPGQASPIADPAHLTLVLDSDGSAWAAFENLLPASERSEEACGGAFLFERGGCLAQAWEGSGHAEDALQALHRRQ